MGGRKSLGAPRGRRTSQLLRAVAIATVTTVLPLAASAAAAHAASPIVPTDRGLSEPAGVAVTPDGKVWVSDAVEGLCQVADEPDAVTGSHLVHDDAGYCAPEVHVAEGEAVPGPARPSATFQIAFDAAGCDASVATDARKCNFYVAEGTSGSSGVWRMHWNPQTYEIDSAAKIYSAVGDNRVFGLALSPEGHVDFSSKRDNIIRRLSDPGSAPFFLTAEAVGFSAVEGVPSLAHLGQALVLADGAGVTRIATPGPDGGLATPIPGLPAGATVSAVAADPTTGRIYAGTSSGKLLDSVLAASEGRFVDEPYDGAFANVTGLTVKADGTLLIAHDPTAALSPGVDTPGLAELFSTPLTPLNAPRATLTATPRPAEQGRTPADRTFAFTSRDAEADLWCKLDGGAAERCGTGQGTFVADELDEGQHSFAVWATAAGHDGPPAKWFFTVDRTAPDVTIDEPTSTTAVGGALRMHFSSSDSSASFQCALDDEVLAPCSPARDLAGVALGEHTFRVRAVDTAGNLSDEQTWSFTSVPAPRAPAGAAPQQPAAGGQAAGPATIRVLVASRKPQIDISVPCVEVSPPAGRGAFSLQASRASIRFRAPAQARYAKLTLRRSSGRRASARIVETLGYSVVRSAGARHTSRISLTAGQRRALRAGRVGLAIAYGTCRTQVGQWEWLQTTTQEGSR